MRRVRQIHCEAWEKDELWFGQCLEVAIGVQGETLDDVKKQLSELLPGYVKNMREHRKAKDKVIPAGRVRNYRIRLLKWHFGFQVQRIVHLATKWTLPYPNARSIAIHAKEAVS